MQVSRKTWLYLLGIATLSIIAFLVYRSTKPKDTSSLEVEIKRGPFEITVFTTGELDAKNSVNIMGPSGLRAVRIWQVKIADLIAEGTVVKNGQYIGALDKTEITNNIKDEESELAKKESQFIQTKLDTTLELRKARDEISNLKYTVQEKQIIVEQSTYEPPATIRQVTNDLEKAKRELDQAIKNYKVKEQQSVAKMQEVNASLQIAKNKLEMLKSVLEEFTITAPKDGMLIYYRNWDGQKLVIGSTVNAWNPIVATLPDLSVMMSKTYVNEVDIRKVKVGQDVDISLDAFPDKKLTGKVKEVANVGEQSPNSDAKVFEVKIQINEKDTTLRPAMTTGNRIIAEKLDSVLYAPLEAIHSQGDTITYVYKKAGLASERTEVTIGKTNDNFAEITAGLKEGEIVLLTIPSKGPEMELVKLPEE